MPICERHPDTPMQRSGLPKVGGRCVYVCAVPGCFVTDLGALPTARARDLAMSAPSMSEHEHQVTLINKARGQSEAVPELALLFAIPNGGERDARAAGRMKLEGVSAGIPDLFLPVARMGKGQGVKLPPMYHGLWIEMKIPGKYAEPHQRAWHKALRAQGYAVEVCHGWEIAWGVLLSYLGGEYEAQGNQ